LSPGGGPIILPPELTPGLQLELPLSVEEGLLLLLFAAEIFVDFVIFVEFVIFRQFCNFFVDYAIYL
jgi:hypothetical protein